MKKITTDELYVERYEQMERGCHSPNNLEGNEIWIPLEEHEAFKEKITTKLKECDSVVIETPKQRQASVYRTTILELIELLECK